MKLFIGSRFAAILAKMKPITKVAADDGEDDDATSQTRLNWTRHNTYRCYHLARLSPHRRHTEMNENQRVSRRLRTSIWKFHLFATGRRTSQAVPCLPLKLNTSAQPQISTSGSANSNTIPLPRPPRLFTTTSMFTTGHWPMGQGAQR